MKKGLLGLIDAEGQKSLGKALETVDERNLRESVGSFERRA
jgi:hypothetical protein